MKHHIPDPAEMAAIMAKIIIETLHEAAARRGKWSLALAGGNTPRLLYCEIRRLLADNPLPGKGFIMPGDERLAKSGSPERNENMIRETLLKNNPQLEKIFLPLPAVCDHKTPLENAGFAENNLRKAWQGELSHDGFPIFDIILLGMGNDGHTASIFPDSPAMTEHERWLMAVPAPITTPPPLPRLTITPPLISAAGKVMFMVSGKEKNNLVEQILNNKDDVKKLPAAKVRNPQKCDWFMTGQN